MTEFEIQIEPTADALARAALERVVAACQASHARDETFRLALAGGGTPGRLYALLAKDERMDWSRVELYFGDERLVDSAHASSNYFMVSELLLQHIEIAPSQVFRVETERGAKDAASHYAGALGDRPLSMALLGMGGDGHTASLFPGSQFDAMFARSTAEQPAQPKVVVTESPVPPTTRVSLSLYELNRAADVLVMVSGEGKAERAAEALTYLSASDFGTTPGNAPLPVAAIRPQALRWLLDAAAAKKFQSQSS